MRRSFTLLALLFVYSTCLFAQAPYLVKDLGNGGSGIASSEPKAFLATGGTLFFAAANATNGLEPWVRDGVGTRLLRDINAGVAGSNILRFIELTPGVVIFTADDGVNGPQLWRSDGTEAGTTLLKIVNGTTSSFTPLLSYGGRVFFFVDDGIHGREPWVTDGTANGTQMLVETAPGTAGGFGQFFRFANTTRFFGVGGIWTTDGTPGGTTLNIPLSSFRTSVAVTAGAFYFFGGDAVHGLEPWKSDGTAAGTSMIKEIRSGTASYTTAIAPTASGAVFFADDGTGAGGRLWTTDGTAANTVPLEAFPVMSSFTPVFYQTSLGIFFTSPGNQVWRTDGTQAGTYIACTLNNSAFNFTDAFSKVYFTKWDGGLTHLYHFDGSQGATPVSVLPELPATNVVFTGGEFWFAGTDATHGSELWVSHDGTAAGTELVANIAPDPPRSSTPVNFRAAGPLLYFHPSSPLELWRSDGTSGGTFEVTDVDNNLISPAPFGSLTPFRGDLYYHRSHSELYRVDGLNGGATKIGEYSFDTMAADENYIYMWTYGSFANVMRSDGTAAGAIQLYDPNEPDHLRGNYDSIMVLPYGGYAWILCYHGLFRSAGTVATTQRVASLPSSSGNGYLAGGLVEAGGLLYSTIWTGTNGVELWRSDGSGSGSYMVDANPGAASTSPSNLTAAGRLLFFTATDPEHGIELWRSDGTAAGTFMVKDIRPGTTSSGPSTLAGLGEDVYFAANDGTNGMELWKSNGTEAGTVLVRDLAPGPMSSKPVALAAAGGKIWFSANDGLHGYELWSSDGTEEGTMLAGDIIPGSSSSSPDKMTAAASTLFFSATTDAEGRELWAMPLTTGYVSVTGGRAAEGNSSTRALRFTITRNGVSSAAASVAYATLPGSASAGTDYTATNGTIQFAGGETLKFVDVTIHGDTSSEQNETLFLQLSSPTGVVLQNAIGAGVIEDDDARADLVAGLEQHVSGYNDAPRLLRVTNLGPSSASSITVTYTESPYAFSVYSPEGTVCTATIPSQCTISFLQPGDSRTLTVYRSNTKGLVDPALPPGRTVTVQVSSTVTDPDLANNTASAMTTDNGMLLLPSKLVVGTSATATFDLGANASSATDVTLTSSAANVVVTPATGRIEPGQRVASFTLTTSAGANKTLLTATIASQTKAALVVPVVANGQSPLLDVAIVADSKSTLKYGELFVIPVHVAARYPDGTVPAGLVTLLDQTGNPLSQLTLDTQGAATFTRPQPAPGPYDYRIEYSGDARFHPLIVSLPTITIEKARATVAVHAPTINCSNTIEFHVVVIGPEGTATPTGTVTLTTNEGTLGTFTLTPNGTPSQSHFTTTQTFANGSRYVIANYSGDGTFSSSTGRKDLRVGCSAMNLVATATSPTSVTLSWTQPAPTTTGYAIFRSGSIEGTYQFIAQTSSFTAVDTTVLPGRIYLYYVSAFGAFGTPSYNSGVEIASTFAYTNNPLTAGTPIKSVHMTELRAMVAALTSAAALPPMTFSGSVAPGNIMDTSQISELRSFIDASRSRIGLPAIDWTQQNIGSGTIIRAGTLQELRGAAQ
jgi:ELWxxDGT repeat protein